MAVPKRKTSHARKSSRRSTVWKLNAPTLRRTRNLKYRTRWATACCCPVFLSTVRR